MALSQVPSSASTVALHGGEAHGALMSELIQEVETKRTELESMTMSVVQWKQNFKDKIMGEKAELLHDLERSETRRVKERTDFIEKASQRIFNLHGRLNAAIAFQKLCENRKQVLWLQRVKELKSQCETLREEASVAAENSLSASKAFSQSEFVQRLLDCLTNLALITQNDDEKEIVFLSDVIAVGNAYVADKLRNLLASIQQRKRSEFNMRRKAMVLMQSNGAHSQLVDRVAALENELAAKRKAVESLSLQLELERDARKEPLLDGSPRPSPAPSGGTLADSPTTQRQLRALIDSRMKFEEENQILRNKLTEIEQDNDILRKKVAELELIVDAKRFDDKHNSENHKNSSELSQNSSASQKGINLSDVSSPVKRIASEKAVEQILGPRRKIKLDEENSKFSSDDSMSSDLLHLMHLCAVSEKRAEEAEIALKQEQVAAWKLQQENKYLEAKLSDSGTRVSRERLHTSSSSVHSPQIMPRESWNSVVSASTTTSSNSNEIFRLQRELKIMTELKEAAVLSLNSLRTELNEKVVSIEIANLRIENKIGSGSFAEVYRGEWIRPCAIKKMRGLTRRRQLQDFYREAQIMQMLNHNGIVQLMGICMNIPELYLVTELVVGSSLEEILHLEKRKLSSNEVLSTTIQIAEAMLFLHLANVIHRDLKPSNCLIDVHGSVKICDFGLARILGKDSSSGSEASRAGTPVYLAPEALQGGTISNKVDVYSFAIICWEMLTGLQAWATLDYKQMVAAVLRDRLRPTLPPDISKEWRALIDQCWSHDPGDRPCFSAIIVTLQEMGAPRPVKHVATSSFKNIELV